MRHLDRSSGTSCSAGEEYTEFLPSTLAAAFPGIAGHWRFHSNKAAMNVEIPKDSESVDLDFPSPSSAIVIFLPHLLQVNLLPLSINKNHLEPFRLIGAEAIFLIEVIPMIVASALHHLLEFNYGYLYLLLGFTIYVSGCAHFMHVAYDIGGKDVLLGLVLQIPFYIVNGKLLIRALALSFCVVLCFCKYMMYSAPELPEHGKSTKELEQLPC
ncbi:hypothetical protein CQW23_21700 [Capsicum baccatum]|uniref:Uncharacterized protein n=1 Tax=Capsicum baccatum TaxID=33114 RepID=A0A2G2VYQ5_CAPBA|nr:hypothetical protein CQW23_21700 [Capsicum baccatum]